MTNKQIGFIAFFLILALLYLGVFITFFGDDKTNTKNEETTKTQETSKTTKTSKNNNELLMIFNPHIMIKYENNKYYYLKNDLEYKKYKFDIYDGFEYVGEYSVNYEDKENLTDENNNIYEIKNSLFGITGNVDYNIKNVSTSEIDDNDKEIFKKVLKDNNITSKNIVNSKKYLVDINNDNNDEVIYIIDNANLSNTYGESNSYSFVFTYIDKKINYIYKDINKISNHSQMGIVSLKSVIDINKDNKNEIILSLTYNDKGCLNIYTYNKKKFKKQLDCNL